MDNVVQLWASKFLSLVSLDIKSWKILQYWYILFYLMDHSNNYNRWYVCFWRVQLSYSMILLQWHLFSVPRSLEVGSFSCNFSTRQHLTESQLNVPSSPDFLGAAESCFLATQAFTMHGHYIRYLHTLARPRVYLVYLEWSQLSLRNPKSSAHEPV